MRKVAASVGILLASILPVMGQDDTMCEYAPAIVSISDTILAKRTELSRLPARRFGAHAAYLKIRYGRLDDAEIGSVLAPLIEDSAPPLAWSLAFAWSYGMSGGIPETVLGPEPVGRAVSTRDVSAMRAMIREGDVDELMAAIAADPDGPNSAFGMAVVATLDLPDAEKAELAKVAMAHGLPILAAGFVATQLKSKAWDAFVERLDPETASLALSMWSWIPAAVGNPMLLRPGANAVTWERISDIAIVAMKIPQYEFLNTLLNQSGRIDEVGAAALGVHEAIERGAIDPRGTLDMAWLVAYRRLTEVWGDLDDLQRQLRSFETAPERSGLPDRTLGVIERLVAITVLTPYLRGQTEGPSTLPDVVSPEFEAQWPQWLEIAARVRADPTDPSLLAGEMMRPAAEMLLASGETDALAASIAVAPVSLSFMELAQDMAIRLDRLCEGYLSHTAESAMLAGTPIFKFDDRDNQ